jgi:hypothetical protein
MFGAVNALFLGLAFAGIIFAILLQGKQLGLQMQHLHEMKKELHGQKEMIAVHAAAIKRQSFEKTFYILLERLTDLAAQVQFKHIKGVELLSGDRAFEVFVTTIVPELWGTYGSSSQSVAIQVRDVFKSINRKIGSPFTRLFGMLSTLLTVIEDERDIDKNFYFNLLLSQLTEYQVAVLSYYGVSEAPGNIKLIIEKHRLLRDLKTDVLFIDYHLELYDERAFQKNNSDGNLPDKSPSSPDIAITKSDII